MIRKTFALGLTALFSASALAPDASAQLESIQVASGLSSPIGVVSVPGDTSNRLFVVQQGGRIRIVENGVTLSPDFLNIDPLTNGGGESGLLGMVFHPDYDTNGLFYISYTNLSGSSMVVQYSVSGTNPNVADAGSAVTIYGPISQPFSNHNGGCIQFGPDGMLYFGIGDGGGAGDPGNRAQNINNPLGKMLRFDVDIAAPHIPASNPFVGVAGLDEIWAYGLRNPWRFSFDRLTGDMWIGDVGQNAWEEIDFQPASSTGGENYGWRILEASSCYNPSTGCSSAGTVLPVHEYALSGPNCAVVGGYVARGPLLPNYQGRFFFADYCAGQLKSIDPGSPAIATNHASDVSISGAITSFGEDTNGDLLVVTSSGRVYRVQEECSASIATYCTTSPNSQGAGAIISSTGSGSISDNNFGVAVAGVPPGQPGIFFYGDLQASAPFGQGTLCVGGTSGVIRIKPSLTASFLGTANRNLDFTQPPFDAGMGLVTGGSTWHFQYWYRDPGFGFNLSNALAVTFCP
jgi:glucose/arabinose dehydrogenase